MRTRFFLASLFVSAGFVACGGATPSDLFSEATSDGGSTTTTTDASNGNGFTGTDSATPPPPEPDAAVPPPTPDSGPPKGAVLCGEKTCPVGDTCCANGAATPFRYECRAGNVKCDDPSILIQCDSAEDCASGSAKICCGERVFENGRTTYRDLTCRSSCNGGDVRFCNPSSPAASCGAQGRCGPSTILPGYNTCQ